MAQTQQITPSKKCAKCGNTFPLTAQNFYVCRSSKSGFHSSCKSCHKLQRDKRRSDPNIMAEDRLKARQWAKANKDKVRRYNAKGRERPESRCSNIIARARKIGVPHCDKSVLVAWLIAQPNTCHYCGIPEELVYEWSKGKNSRLSVDKKDPNGGYLIDNMVMSCFRCNTAKSHTWTYEEFVSIANKAFRPLASKFIMERELGKP